MEEGGDFWTLPVGLPTPLGTKGCSQPPQLCLSVLDPQAQVWNSTIQDPSPEIRGHWPYWFVRAAVTNDHNLVT